MLITVIETPEYLKRAGNIFSENEMMNITFSLATQPTAGTIIQGTGGVRKLRWGVHNKGKRSGARLIYYYHDKTIPLTMLTAFEKSERANISKSERNELKILVKKLVKSLKAKR